MVFSSSSYSSAPTSSDENPLTFTPVAAASNEYLDGTQAFATPLIQVVATSSENQDVSQAYANPIISATVASTEVSDASQAGIVSTIRASVAVTELSDISQAVVTPLYVVTAASTEATDASQSSINESIQVSSSGTEVADAAQGSVSLNIQLASAAIESVDKLAARALFIESNSASGMSRKFWTDYYTQAWAKPVLTKAEVLLPATMVKKSVVAQALANISEPKANLIEKTQLNTQAHTFISKLLEENKINIAAELAIIESKPLKSLEISEDEELMLMAMVL